MKFIPTHPVFIFGEILKDISDSEIQKYKDFVLNDSYKKDLINESNYSTNQQVLNNTIFTNLKSKILDYSRIYLNKLNHTYENVQISNSWFNFVNNNEGIKGHVHVNSYISGVFYFDNDSPIDFFNPLDEKWYFKPEIKSPPFRINPKPNLLILFPSFYPHSITPSNSLNPRLSIAFNIIPKGEFGFDTQKLYL